MNSKASRLEMLTNYFKLEVKSICLKMKRLIEQMCVYALVCVCVCEKYPENFLYALIINKKLQN